MKTVKCQLRTTGPFCVAASWGVLDPPILNQGVFVPCARMISRLYSSFSQMMSTRNFGSSQLDSFSGDWRGAIGKKENFLEDVPSFVRVSFEG